MSADSSSLPSASSLSLGDASMFDSNASNSHYRLAFRRVIRDRLVLLREEMERERIHHEHEGGSEGSATTPSRGPCREQVEMRSPLLRRRQALDCGSSAEWGDIMGNWAEWSSTGRSVALRRIVYTRGIPRPLRSTMYLRFATNLACDLPLCKRLDSSTAHSCIYQDLLGKESAWTDDILKDLDRTFVAEDFIEIDGFGREALREVLHVYSVLDDQVGYCQGMAFVAAALLMHMSSERAFWVMHRLMVAHDLRQFFVRDMYPLRRSLFQLSRLVETQLPRLHRHLSTHGAHVSLICAPWFLSCFFVALPLTVALRVLDTVVMDGVLALFSVALALLGESETELLREDFEGIMLYFREEVRHSFAQGDALLSRAALVRIKSKQFERWGVEFDGIERERQVSKGERRSSSSSSSIGDGNGGGGGAAGQSVSPAVYQELVQRCRRVEAERDAMQVELKAVVRRHVNEVGTRDRRIEQLQREKIAVSELLATALDDARHCRQQRDLLLRDHHRLSTSAAELPVDEPRDGDDDGCDLGDVSTASEYKINV